MKRLLNDGPWQVAGFVPSDADVRRVWDNPSAAGSYGTVDWVAATVPGHVQSDLIDAGVIADPFVDRQSLLAEWTSGRDWVYRTTFDAAPGPARLCFEGVDHDCRVVLNSVTLGDHHGMFAFAWDVELKATNVLVVIVRQAPANEDQLGDTARVRNWKPRFTYFWDFSARLVPVGIWGDVWIEDVAGLSATSVVVEGSTVRVASPAGTAVTILDPSGERIASGGPGAFVIDDPRRWWPNGHGEQPLYTVLAELRDESIERRIGFRTLTFDDFDLVVNNTSIPVLGWNWVPVHQFYGRRHEAAYHNLIKRAKHAGVTMLRVWGGGLLERELFYDLCDEAGIVVWQDFIQSSSALNCEPSVDEKYTAMCGEQARLMVLARRHHASLGVWCGGNELATGSERVPLTDDHPNAVALREIVRAEDPQRAWLVTTPTGDHPVSTPGVPTLNVHGGYKHLGFERQREFYDHLICRFQGEVGVYGAGNIETLRRTLTDPWPRDENWIHKSSWWNRYAATFEAFGEIDDLNTFVAASQWMQALGLRAIVDAARARWPRQRGLLLWQINEPWPNTACTSVIDVFGHPKPAYWAVAEAFRATASDSEEIWYDAISGVRVDGPGDAAVTIRTVGERQDVVASGELPLRPLLDVKAELDVVTAGRKITVTARGGPLHGVFLQTVTDHGGPYLDRGWRWFVPAGHSWTAVAEGGGEIVVGALNAPAMTVAID